MTNVWTEEYPPSTSESGSSKQRSDFCTRGRERREVGTLPANLNTLRPLSGSKPPYSGNKATEIEWLTRPDITALSTPAANHAQQDSHSRGQANHRPQTCNSVSVVILRWWGSLLTTESGAQTTGLSTAQVPCCLNLSLGPLSIFLFFRSNFLPLQDCSYPDSVAGYPSLPNLWLFPVLRSPV